MNNQEQDSLSLPHHSEERIQRPQPQVHARSSFSASTIWSVTNEQTNQIRQPLSPNSRAFLPSFPPTSADALVLNQRAQQHSSSALTTCRIAPAARKDMKHIKQEKQIRSLQQELFQLANHYFLFQGVILTAIFCGSSSLKCRYRWFPIILSAVTGLINLIALVTISVKLTKLVNQKELAVISGSRTESGASEALAGEAERTILYKCRKGKRMVILWSSLILFIGFLLVVLVGSWKILCYQSDFNSLSNLKNCNRLCDKYDNCMLICPEK